MNEPNIKFEESFFEEEERCGFVVSSIMKRVWAAEMEVLYEFDRICKKYGLKYFAVGGTLLGAVRHKGFIPWDDDIDIGMPRKDYEKFLKIAVQELPEGFVIRYREDIEHRRETFFCMLNASKVSVASDRLKRFHNCPYVVGIDVMPIDYLPRDKEEQRILKSVLRIVYSIIVAEDESLENNLNALEDLMNVKFNRDETLRQQLLDYFVQLCSMYGEHECDDVVIHSFWIVDKSYIYPKELFDEVTYLPFENIEIPVPIGYETKLKMRYGNYMEPVRGGSYHDYPFFKKQQIEFDKFLKAHGVDASQYEGLLYKVEESDIED